MQKIFTKAAELERLSKEKFSIPPFLMMENAARAMADFIISKNGKKVLILCGKGNNGGDGYALARLLLAKQPQGQQPRQSQASCQVTLLCFEEPSADEARAQYQICRQLGIKIVTDFIKEDFKQSDFDIVADCLYGIGFHGQLRKDAKNVLDYMNNLSGIKIACDISSALYFKADYTITMGEQKLALFSDKARAVSGQIIVADLGIPRESFESSLQPDAYLIEESDMKLPLRKNAAANKGTYGHTTIAVGEKAGAGIIAGTAAMEFGSGLTTLFKTKQSNLAQFKISPELMIADEIPAKTSALVVGPGFSVNDERDLEFLEAINKHPAGPALVLDAGLFSYEKICDLLARLNTRPNARIILTPHLAEFQRFMKKLQAARPDLAISDDDLQMSTLANSPETKLRLLRLVNSLYPRTAVIVKSANTFVAAGGEIYICRDGAQALAKGGSGDVLAGMCGALLAQGYDVKSAAVTAVEAHALAGKKNGAEDFSLTPLSLINSMR